MDTNFKEELNIQSEIQRYFIFWPWFLASIFSFLFIAYMYLRYADYEYLVTSVIEIKDEAQDSEMALPTSLTVFNRSMINLENEKSILKSYSIHKNVASSLTSNWSFYTKGNLVSRNELFDDWFKEFEFDFKEIDSNEFSQLEYEIKIIDKSKIFINYYKDGDFIKEYTFSSLSTESTQNDLPFELTILNIDSFQDRFILISPLDKTVNRFRDVLSVEEYGKNSDQLILSLRHSNVKIAEQYLNALINEFDSDGISDRQLEYKRTIDFVNSRSEILRNELELIEMQKENFKKSNNLGDLKNDATINIQQKNNYSVELFNVESQKELASYLIKTIAEKPYEYIPLNIGFEDFDINVIIKEYNQLLSERDRYLISAGPNNSLVKSIERQLNSYSENIYNSISNFLQSIEIKLTNLKSKEIEFLDIYNDVPANERILRSIQRELEVKEALFLLLLQKKEEASINLAVVKPTIKVIDYAIAENTPISPNKTLTFSTAILLGILFPLTILFLIFYFDNKIHTRSILTEYVGNIPVIGEVPYISDSHDLSKFSDSFSRTPIAESIRMISANLNFTKIEKNTVNDNVILVTSSVKGEGKTLISTNLASIMSSKSSKVLLIGADLRNPQIHKFLDIDKSTAGLSDYIYLDNLEWRDLLIKNENFEVLLSGKIPPNPTQLLASEKFKTFLNSVSKEYDYVIVDSAPCLLVSDTFEISKYVGFTVYVVRANYSEKNLATFINECYKDGKLSNMNLVLNGVGDSKSYGYKYGYQYGYRYGYKYGYNYGYGYGYKEDDK